MVFRLLKMYRVLSHGQMGFRAVMTNLLLVILALMSSSRSPILLMMVPLEVNYPTSSICWSPRWTGVFWRLLILMAFVFSALIMSLASRAVV